MLLISIGNSRTLKIIQTYAQTSLCEEEELEDFYLEVDEALKKKPLHGSNGRLQHKNQK